MELRDCTIGSCWASKAVEKIEQIPKLAQAFFRRNLGEVRPCERKFGSSLGILCIGAHFSHCGRREAP